MNNIIIFFSKLSWSKLMIKKEIPFHFCIKRLYLLLCWFLHFLRIYFYLFYLYKLLYCGILYKDNKILKKLVPRVFNWSLLTNNLRNTTRNTDIYTKCVLFYLSMTDLLKARGQ